MFANCAEIFHHTIKELIPALMTVITPREYVGTLICAPEQSEGFFLISQWGYLFLAIESVRRFTDELSFL